MRRVSELSAVMLLVLAFFAVGVPAASGQEYAFDAGLSLTGGCNTSTIDPTPDPGLCPMPPGVPGVDHPPASFQSPRAVTTDFHGNIYVASYGTETGSPNGRIDVFDSSGNFITEISTLLDPAVRGPRSLAVDSEGTLYVFQFRAGVARRLERFEPSLYEPALGEIAYEEAPVLVPTGPLSNSLMGLAVNPLNDHLFAHKPGAIAEFKSAAEDNEPLPPISLSGPGVSTSTQDIGLAVDAANGRIYASVQMPEAPAGPYVIRVIELDAPHNLIQTIEGAELPGGKFEAEPAIAVDEKTGDVFTYFETDDSPPVFIFNKDGEFEGTVEREFEYPFTGAQVWVDNGPSSPNPGYLFVPSHPVGVGHAFAFGPEPEACAPVISSVSFANVTQDEAELSAQINPCNRPTSYTIEITPEPSFEAEGFEGAAVLGKGEIPTGSVPVAVSSLARGLSPNTAYRFRVVATNEVDEVESSRRFVTYPADVVKSCPNQALRTAFSAHLPDCRAYELVTPGATNARTPIGVGFLGIYFPTRHASPAGDRVSFFIEGGVIPGSDGTGSLGGDPYLSSRGTGGWSTAVAGPDGNESPALIPGSTSPDQEHSFWATGSSQGTAALAGSGTSYVRYPGGHSELIGRGSLAIDPKAQGLLISEGGDHIIFTSGQPNGTGAVQLEEDAPPDGTTAIYDRTGGVTQVVSLLPGNVPAVAGQNAAYQGASLDGEGVAFTIGGTLYLRHDNSQTYEVGSGLTFAGVAEGGERVFYLEGGNLKAFDVESGPVTFATGGDVTPVNVSADGSSAYFVSPDVLTGEEGPSGQTPVGGAQNLYLSREGALSFIGIVTDRDVEGELSGTQIDGLGLWVSAVTSGGLGRDPSRTTPDGDVLLFKSRAKLGEYDPEGHAQVYRYDAVAGTLDCLSCNPTGAAPSGDATLQSISEGRGASPEPFSSFAFVANLRSDGRRAFFESPEALVPGDTDQLLDVYEWEAQGVGSCTRPAGCVYLISSAGSDRPEYLYAVSDNGDDVFFRSSDLLLPADKEGTPSIYDARVGGGFPEPATPGPCQGEGCRPVLTPAPLLPAPAQPVTGADDNVKRKAARKCPKGKRKVRRKGKVRCVRKMKQRRSNHSRGSRR